MIPLVVAGYFFVRYFLDAENAEHKANTVKACLYVVLSSVIAFIITVVGLIHGPTTIGDILDQFITQIIYCLFFFYFAGVCRRL